MTIKRQSFLAVFVGTSDKRSSSTVLSSSRSCWVISLCRPVSDTYLLYFSAFKYNKIDSSKHTPSSQRFLRNTLATLLCIGVPATCS